jgi:hypothetical protein
MQNPMTENQRKQLRMIINKIGYPGFLAWLNLTEPDIHPDYITCPQAQRILNKLSAQQLPAEGPIVISERIAKLTLRRDKNGDIVALHLCKPLGEHQAFDNPKHCPAWKRIDAEVWRPRHMQAYGRMCAACGKYMPQDIVLEAAYHNAELAGLDKLEELNF